MKIPFFVWPLFHGPLLLAESGHSEHPYAYVSALLSAVFKKYFVELFSRYVIRLEKGDEYGDIGNRYEARHCIESHTVNSKLCYPPNLKEGWSHDNQLATQSLMSQYNLNVPRNTATKNQKLA